jgi:hypothetical protein
LAPLHEQPAPLHSFSHTPAPPHTSLQPERQSFSSQVPAPEQLMEQEPPSQVSSVAPDPVLRLEQPPSGQWNVQEPPPEQEKAHPLLGLRGSGTHVSSQASSPEQAQSLPGTHSGDRALAEAAIRALLASGVFADTERASANPRRAQIA